MSNAEKGIYSTKFMFKTQDGVEDFIYLKPLPVKCLPKLFKVAARFNGTKEEDVLVKMDEETMTDLTELVHQAVKKSLPSDTDEVVDSFVSQHFMELIGAVFETNFKNKQ